MTVLAAAQVRIYDPYYCEGSVSLLLTSTCIPCLRNAFRNCPRKSDEQRPLVPLIDGIEMPKLLLLLLRRQSIAHDPMVFARSLEMPKLEMPKLEMPKLVLR